jgi:hypothetical protein
LYTAGFAVYITLGVISRIAAMSTKLVTPFRLWAAAFVFCFSGTFFLATNYASPQRSLEKLAESMNRRSQALDAASIEVFSSDLNPKGSTGGEPVVHCQLRQCSISLSEGFVHEDYHNRIHIYVEVALQPELMDLRQSSLFPPSIQWKEKQWKWSVRQVSKDFPFPGKNVEGTLEQVTLLSVPQGSAAIQNYIYALATHMRNQLEAQ